MNDNGSHNTYLVERNRFLEARSRWYSLALNVLTDMTTIHANKEESREPLHIIRQAQDSLVRLFELDCMAFMLIEEGSNEFQLSHCWPEHQHDRLQAIAEHLIETRHFAWALNQTRPYSVQAEPFATDITLQVIATQTRIRGMFLGQFQAAKPVDEEAGQILTMILTNCAYALESAALYQLVLDQRDSLRQTVAERSRQLQYRHSYDTLTGLPNLAEFRSRFHQALHDNEHLGKQLAVAIADLDKFKSVNDLVGRRGGDQTICTIGQRLAEQLRHYDVVSRGGATYGRHEVSRLDGEAFCIMLVYQESQHDMQVIVERLMKTVSQPIEVGSREIALTASIGIAIAPTDAIDVDQLLRYAELALQNAKRHGGNTCRFYTKDLEATVYNHLLIDNRLNKALANREFQVYFQPQICAQQRRTVAAEALLRWVQNNETVVGPDQFIPAAEQNGLIVPIGEWVLFNVCEQIAKLASQGQRVRIAVNLSARQFKEPNLLASFQAILRDTHIDPALLEVEITESILLQDMINVIEIMESLAALGVRIALDDFGTGYSSLNYLKRLPINVIKIDRSFVQDISHNNEDQAIVSAIIVMAHKLGLEVVAEGVETAEQEQILQAQGCHLLQGYRYAKPLPHPDFIKHLFDSKPFGE